MARYQKPHKWKPRKDAPCCVACEQPFVDGDSVFNAGCLNIHACDKCLSLYRAQCEELGIEP